jgi:hypothetical protein
VDLVVQGGTIEARIGTWGHYGELTRRISGYFLGENEKGEPVAVHDRTELDNARRALKDKTKLAPLVKFLLTTSGDGADAEARVKDVAQCAVSWFESESPQKEENQPSSVK